MGMLATMMNGLAMRDALERSNIQSRVMSAIPMSGIVEHYDRREAMRDLKGAMLWCSARALAILFTTDSAACLRGIEIDADVVLKATKVDGVYSDDPVTNPDAFKYDRLTYDEVLERRL